MLANEGQVAIEEVDEKVVIGDQAAEKKKPSKSSVWRWLRCFQMPVRTSLLFSGVKMISTPDSMPSWTRSTTTSKWVSSRMKKSSLKKAKLMKRN